MTRLICAERFASDAGFDSSLSLFMLAARHAGGREVRTDQTVGRRFSTEHGRPHLVETEFCQTVEFAMRSQALELPKRPGAASGLDAELRRNTQGGQHQGNPKGSRECREFEVFVLFGSRPQGFQVFVSGFGVCLHSTCSSPLRSGRQPDDFPLIFAETTNDKAS